MPFHVGISFSLLISGQTILFYSPAVRLRGPAQREVFHLCMRILTPCLLVVVKNSSPELGSGEDCVMAAGPLIDLKKCVACFLKEVGCHCVCESLYFNTKSNCRGNCFERFCSTSPFISISYSDNQCNSYHH